MQKPSTEFFCSFVKWTEPSFVMSRVSSVLQNWAAAPASRNLCFDSPCQLLEWLQRPWPGTIKTTPPFLTSPQFCFRFGLEKKIVSQKVVQRGGLTLTPLRSENYVFRGCWRSHLGSVAFLLLLRAASSWLSVSHSVEMLLLGNCWLEVPGSLQPLCLVPPEAIVRRCTWCHWAVSILVTS